MEITSGKLTKKKALKTMCLELTPNESTIFPRERYGTIRNTLSLLKVEHPTRCFLYEVIDKGVRVICVR